MALIGGICFKQLKLLELCFGIADCRDDGFENLLRKGFTKARRINVTENPNVKPEKASFVDDKILNLRNNENENFFNNSFIIDCYG